MSKSEILDRLPPQSLESERAALGSLLLDPKLIDDVALLLKPTDFYLPANQILARRIFAMHNEGLQVDTRLLMERLKTAGEAAAAGGWDYLCEISESVPTAANATYYAQIVRDKATLRALILGSTEILRLAYDQTAQPAELLALAESKFTSALADRTSAEPVHLQESLVESLEEIDRIQREGKQRGIDSGFYDVDRFTGGLLPGHLIVLAARPGMGKSAFAANIGEYVGVENCQPVLFFSLEMSRAELSTRMLCSAAQVDSLDANRGRLGVAERSRLTIAANRLSNGRLFVDDLAGRTVSEVASQARRFKRKHGLSLVVVDYLQRIRADNPRDVREQQVAQMSARLKDLALELKIPVLCLAQLNRQTEASGDHRPKLSHLRESGAIEQDADVVVFIHRDDYYQPDPAKHNGIAEIHLAKVRGGAVGVAKLGWQPVWCRFVDAPRDF